MHNSKVAWLESQYLFPQHFQQQERYFEALVESRCGPIAPHRWGFDEVALEQAALGEGRIALRSARGLLPDGTPFELPLGGALPPPLCVPASTRDALVHLALPSYQPGSRFLEVGDAAGQIARYRLNAIDVFDYAVDGGQAEVVESAMPCFRLVLDPEDLGGYSTLALARIREVTPEGAVVLDNAFIPPVLCVRAALRLRSLLADLIGMIKQRANTLAARFNQPGGNSAIADFLLLQLLNGFEPRLQHLQSLARVHPERLYAELQGLLGQLATFTTEAKRPAELPPYAHHDLYRSFHLLGERLNQYLSAVLEQTAIALPVEARQYGIHVARIVDRSLLRQARFVLAARAEASTDAVRDQLPTMLKLGTVETIRDLVNNQLPGIAFTALPVAPREIPFNAGAVYFELANNSELWQLLRNSAGFAFHVAGELPGLEFEFWAIRH